MEVELYHPEIKETIRVSERAARVHRKSGWIDAGDAGDSAGISGQTPHTTAKRGGPSQKEAHGASSGEED